MKVLTILLALLWPGSVLAGQLFAFPESKDGREIADFESEGFRVAGVSRVDTDAGVAVVQLWHPSRLRRVECLVPIEEDFDLEFLQKRESGACICSNFLCRELN